MGHIHHRGASCLALAWNYIVLGEKHFEVRRQFSKEKATVLSVKGSETAIATEYHERV